jgi:hypothetical protein
MSDVLQNYWMFSNDEEGRNNGNDWDMATIFKTRKYYLRNREKNRSYIKLGDTVYLRIYGKGFIGKCRIAGNWVTDAESKEKYGEDAGSFLIENIFRWKTILPFELVIKDLSKHDHRNRLVHLTQDDGIIIEASQRVYERLGFGIADGEMIILEKGLEEAIKPNLRKLGLSLANSTICQQFSMGTGAGRSDLICTDKNGDLVVIELKCGFNSEQVVGQVLRYKGFLEENIAQEGQKVHCHIVTGDYDEGLRLAAKAAGIKVLRVRLP